MKHLRETFTDEEWQRLSESKTNSGLNWHDYLLSRLEFVPVVAQGIVKVKAFCPDCGKQLHVNLNDLK